jgi:pimeloyl-ACP methyl ester carboxylesterase
VDDSRALGVSEEDTEDSRDIAIEPENARYGVDLLLLHGAWVSSDVWQPAARGFAQRGWRCILVEAGAQEPGAPASFAEWVEHAARAAARRQAPPIVLGHDAGALVALALAERARVTAAIAIAPLLEGAAPFISRAWLRVARWRGALVAPPEAGRPYRQAGSGQAAARLGASLAPEPAARLASLERGSTPGRAAVPTLLVAQRDDAAVPAALVEVTARGIEADYRSLPGGHWALLEEGLDAWMSELHRWIIRRIGGSILLLRGDEDLRDE